MIRQNESAERRVERLLKQSVYAAAKRKSESVSERKNRLNKQQEYKSNVIASELPVSKKKRLSKKREHAANVRANETTETRENRLTRMRGHAANMRANKSLDAKEKMFAKHHWHCKTVSELIDRFHNSVTAGPLYICSCCNQLWYKHSVSAAETFRLKYPNMVKYLQNIVSIINNEWLCHSCHNHLRKGKVPPCAVSNGMKFTPKPIFWASMSLSVG